MVVLACKIWGAQLHGDGSLEAEPPVGSRGRAPGQGTKLKHLVFEHSMKAANLPTFLLKRKYFTYLCYLCKKVMGGHATRGVEQN